MKYKCNKYFLEFFFIDKNLLEENAKLDHVVAVLLIAETLDFFLQQFDLMVDIHYFRFRRSKKGCKISMIQIV